MQQLREELKKKEQSEFEQRRRVDADLPLREAKPTDVVVEFCNEFVLGDPRNMHEYVAVLRTCLAKSLNIYASFVSTQIHVAASLQAVNPSSVYEFKARVMPRNDPSSINKPDDSLGDLVTVATCLSVQCLVWKISIS